MTTTELASFAGSGSDLCEDFCSGPCFYCEHVRPRWRLGHITRERNQGEIICYNLVYGPALFFLALAPEQFIKGLNFLELRSTCCNGLLKTRPPSNFYHCCSCNRETRYPASLMTDALFDELEQVSEWATFTLDVLEASLIAHDGIEFAKSLMVKHHAQTAVREFA